ncbi:MAG: ATP-binding protein [Bacilli bacterium]
MENEQYKDIDIYEKSLTTTFRMKLWSRFVKALKEYQLLKPNDKVCVCISGGKDSFVMAKLFKLLLRHSDFHFEVKYLVMDPGYNKENLDLIKHNLKLLNIEAEIKTTNIFDVASIQTKSPCFLCAKMRRGALYKFAKEMGCNKIALGHHYDDVIITTLMNMLNSGSFQTMLPKLHSTNYEGMELIRPLYFIREKDILAYQKHHDLKFLQCACKFTELTKEEDSPLSSKRKETKELIKQLKKTNPQVEKNIFSSANNVTLDMILGYKYKGEYHSFLDDYDKKENE